jgi:hypothetical protein
MRILSSIVVVSLLLAAGPASAATFDLTGTWNFTTSGNFVTGGCPLGKDSAGTLQITQTGDSFTMKVLTGMVCSPAVMCSYTGTIAGATYTATNSAVVDSEGGTATNIVTFTASSATAASGADASTYVHPKMTCNWGFNIVLSRGAPDAGPAADAGVIPGKDIGAGTPDADAGKVDAAAVSTPEDDDSGCQIGGGPAPLWSALPFIGALLALRRRRRR